MDDKLSWGDIEKVYQALADLKPEKIYYVLTEHLTNKTEIYTVNFPDFGNVHVMHPDKFSRFELEAIIAGYQLVDFREVDLLPIRRPLIVRTEWTEPA